MHHGQRCEHCNCDQNDTAQAKNESVWVETAKLPSFPPLLKEESFDVIVIGAGITGLTAALDVARAGQRVAVLEASKIGKGVTGYTTAHVTSIIDTRFQDLIKKLGEDKAKLVAASTRAAIAKIADNITTFSIACDWRYVPGYLYSEREEEQPILEQEAVAGNTVGLSATFIPHVPLPFATVGAAQFEQQAEFHPLKYLAGLVAAFTDAGGKIHEMTRVVNVSDGEPCTVTTDRVKLTADAVIMATHTPITKMLLLQSKIEAYRSYVLGAHIRDELPAGIYWDMEHPYHYLRGYRTLPGPLLIAGGEDHKTGEPTDNQQHYEELWCYVKERFPGATLAYRWSAQVFEPIDYLPYIGRAPRSKHVYVATGYAGNGMTFGTVAGVMAAQQILVGGHAWEKLYKPTRVVWSWSALARQLKISNDIGQHFLLDRLSRGEGSDVGQVPRGEGKILQLDGKKVAVYKDGHGAVTKLSPVCTHAGCLVAWNNAEKTWDCPCHGGRYTPEGHVINGPPIKDLAKVT